MQLYRSLLRRYRPQAFKTTRRDFLALGAAAGITLFDAASAATEQSARRTQHTVRVIVLGAGFAGLSCAYELKRAGYDVHVLEARSRVGGRVVTLRDWMPGNLVEAGGELIGSNHPAWIRYARRFGLNLTPVTGSEDQEGPVLLDGKLLDETQKRSMFEDMDRVLDVLTEQSRTVNAGQPWLTPDADSLDRANFAGWLAAQAPEPLTQRAIAAEFGADNAVDIGQQSLLGMMTQIRGGGLEKYWTDTETHRCREGNDALAKAFARAIGFSAISLHTPVVKIELSEQHVAVEDANQHRWIADHVVMTIPPSVWGKVSFDPPLPIGRSPQMGVNCKYLSRIRNKIWLPHGPDGLSDGIVSETWDGTDAQPGTQRCLTGFSGGSAAQRAVAEYASGGDVAFTELLTALYSRFSDSVLQRQFIDWPNDPWVMAGYSCAAPGEITQIGRTLYHGIGRLQFAGEYSCYAFPGYMEGALQSGIRASQNIRCQHEAFRQTPRPADCR